MRSLVQVLLITVLAPAAAAFAQDNPPAAAIVAPPANPVSAQLKLMNKGTKLVLLGSAERMPEESYAFKPAETVRSFGQIIGHVADAQYLACSGALGETNPRPKIEQTRTSKADLIVALKDAFAYCDKAYDGLTDASGVEIVKHTGRDMPRATVLMGGTLHSVEHYGNLVTYLRMKGIVPPSSDPGFMKQMMK
ncbi:MAG: DinB family protein [Thermoanaerobaculia bacterium]